MQTEDGSLIHKCLNGEPETFSLLVDKYKTGIYAFTYARLGDFHDAQDVTQEVFIQAYTNLRNLKKWDSFVFWLYRIASAQCAKWIRTQARRKDKEFIEDQDPRILEIPSIDSYRKNQVNESLRESLEALPEAYRDVLTLHYIGGMKVMEIARSLSISPSTIARRLREARSQLREEMFAMMSETYEQHKLPVSFTFRIVEAVKRTKIHPTSTMKGLPWGLSLATGIIIAVMSLNPYLHWFSQIGTYARSVLPSETKVLKVGEIPVDIVKTSNMAILSNKMGKGKGGEPKQPDMQNAFFMDPQGEGGEWVKKADMPTGRDNLSTSVVNGKIYAIGGRSNDAQGNEVFIKTVEEYDPVKDTWMKKADMPTARWKLATCVLDGKIYAIGGMPGWSGGFSTVEIYDPVTDTWTKGLDMPTRRGGLSTSVVNGKIYAIGGADNFGPCLSTVEEYDPVKDIWTKKADMPTARFNVSTIVMNGEIYAMGGIPVITRPWHALSTVEVYNPAKDKWTKKADMPTARNGHCTGAVNGKIYVIGGMLDEETLFSTVEVYDPVTDKWMEKANMPTGRFTFSASVVDEKIYAIGGWTAQDLLSTVEEYTPEGWPFAVSPNGKLPTKWGMIKAK
jgi:RNA polymerase sigma factor (sigma-70 family)